MVSILGSLGSLELLVDLHCREAAVTGALWFCGCIYTHTPLGQPRCVSWSEYKLMQFSHWRASWLMTHDLVILFLIYHLYLSGWIGLCYLY